MSSENYGGYGSDKLPQMDTTLDSGRGYNPLNELMRAIILRVIDDYNTTGELREEAVSYLMDNEEDYIFSFIAIARHLGVDPDKMRESIMNPTHRISTRRRAA